VTKLSSIEVSDSNMCPVYNTIGNNTMTLSTLHEIDTNNRDTKNNSNMSIYTPFSRNTNIYNNDFASYLECKSKTIFKIPNAMPERKRGSDLDVLMDTEMRTP